MIADEDRALASDALVTDRLEIQRLRRQIAGARQPAEALAASMALIALLERGRARRRQKTTQKG
jgi:hypothetical protein